MTINPGISDPMPCNIVLFSALTINSFFFAFAWDESRATCKSHLIVEMASIGNLSTFNLN